MSDRKTYTEEFKLEAIRRCELNNNFSAVARDLGLNVNLLYKWKRSLAANPERPFPGHGNPQDVDLARLQRENARLKEENEILKKAVGIFTNPPR